MDTFLNQVASYYSDNSNIEDYCFVFPNRRSGQFFEDILKKHINVPHLAPHILTLTDLLEEVSDLALVTPVDATITLFEAYHHFFDNQETTIDLFVYWSQLMLNDFNDVDLAMANPRNLFSNLSALRNISTDYIDDELKRDIDRILNIQLRESSEEFWLNSQRTYKDKDPNSTEAQYFTLWERLADIYELFHQLLENRGLTTMGHLYRKSAEQLRDANTSPWNYKRIVIVGFAGLTISEDNIFKSLKAFGADFWWDDCLDIYPNAKNPGLEMIRHFKTRYPAPVEIATEQPVNQRIDVMAVPTLQGQAKWAMHLIDVMGKKNAGNEIPDRLAHLPGIDVENAINTAIILPDEQLFVPIISSVPKEVKKMNVTLGYSMRNASINTLMHLAARAHHQATHNKTTGRWMFFRETVLDILSHPLLKSAFTAEVINITTAIENSSEFNVGEELFYKTPLQDLFTTIHDLNSKEEVLGFIDRIINFADVVDLRIRAIEEPVYNENNQETLSLQSAFIKQYISSLQQLKIILSGSPNLPTKDTTIFYLIDRITSNMTIPFTGEPLEGLQVMGVLETRCLDFENIIIPLMNERVYPSRRGISSLIPGFLREAYMLTTNAFHEAVNTYHFYRLCSRAKYLAFIYDSSAQSFGSGEPSRFISQLEKIYNRTLHKYSVSTHINTSSGLEISVKKAPEVISRYVEDIDEKKALSASAINGFIDCPLRFYFQRVQGLDGDTETSDFMDAATFGTIVHNSLQAFYFPDEYGETRKSPNVVNTAKIDDFIKKHLTSTVIREINKCYMHRGKDELDAPIYGDALILQESIETFVKNALNYDKALIEKEGDITILECEVDHVLDLDILGTKFHFTFKIDRLDLVGNTLRVIDYKTGRDSTSFVNASELFNSNKVRNHAILQLLLYCNAYCQLEQKELTIKPMIYKLKNMDETGIFLKKGNNLTQYEFTLNDSVNTEFLNEMKNVVDNLLDKDKRFCQTGNINNCKYCRFTDFCRR